MINIFCASSGESCFFFMREGLFRALARVSSKLSFPDLDNSRCASSASDDLVDCDDVDLARVESYEFLCGLEILLPS